MDEDHIPIIDPLVLEAEESAIVSETDALHSSDDEGSNNVNKNWLSSYHTTGHQNDTAPRNSEDDSENDSADENEMKESAGPEDFYCSNMDDEDEAYVYKHLRSGKEETVHVRRTYHQQQHENKDPKSMNGSSKGSDGQHTNNSLESMLDSHGSDAEENGEKPQSTKQTTPQSADPLEQVRLLKPRNSDAILSCPRCFNVVCMDCQQHERYSNQYRAMFVMNIGVDWSRKMMYDDAIGALKAYSSTRGNRDRNVGGVMAEDGEEGEDTSMPDKIPHDDVMQGSNNVADSAKEAAYYSVHCSYCSLELAALDLSDEIYYFFGCIASS